MSAENWHLAWQVMAVLAAIAICTFGSYLIVSGKRKERSARKRLRQIEEDRRRADAEYEAWRKEVYGIHLVMEVGMQPYVQRTQMRTKAESPEQVGLNALEMYMNVAELYSQGYRLFIGKPSNTGLIPITRYECESLDKIEKNVES